MFEPENQIERDLIDAATSAGARPEFARALLDAEVFIVLFPEAGTSIQHDEEGNTTLPEGAKLTLATATRGEETIIPFFTAPVRARAWVDRDHFVAPDKTRDLFARNPGVSFVLNPGSDFGKEYLPAEIENMLAGRIDGNVTVPAGTTVLLGHPKDRPDALIAALSSELGALKSVRGAWLLLASVEGQPEQTWMLGIDHHGDDWPEVCAAVSSATAKSPAHRPVDITSLKNSSFADTLRTGIPVIAAPKRGLLNWFR